MASADRCAVSRWTSPKAPAVRSTSCRPLRAAVVVGLGAGLGHLTRHLGPAACDRSGHLGGPLRGLPDLPLGLTGGLVAAVAALLTFLSPALVAEVEHVAELVDGGRADPGQLAQGLGAHDLAAVLGAVLEQGVGHDRAEPGGLDQLLAGHLVHVQLRHQVSCLGWAPHGAGVSIP